MIIFFVGNMLYGGLIQTGAFEIYLNEKLIFSKIATGRLPSNIDDIMRLI